MSMIALPLVSPALPTSVSERDGTLPAGRSLCEQAPSLGFEHVLQLMNTCQHFVSSGTVATVPAARHVATHVRLRPASFPTPTTGRALT